MNMTLRNSHNATKIVCTLGPASADAKIIEALARAGMSVARLNFSHGTHQFHLGLIRKVRQVSRKLGQPIAVLQDLCGPKIRVGKLHGGQAILEPGATVRLTSKEVVGDNRVMSAAPAELIPDLKPGDRVLIDDGLIRLEVIKSGHHEITARVVKGGIVREHKGINLPEATLSLPSLTDKDIDDLEFGLKHGVDLIALSFVRTEHDVLKLKNEIKKRGHSTPVIAKLEKPQAIKHLSGIIEVADAVMVARGDLGVEMPLEQVPIIQKNIITIAGEHHKPVITATQMLESMTQNISPTRAEVSDVANAIFDGTDCVMLSGETAAGKYPVETVEMMARIIQTTEQKLRTQPPVLNLFGRPAVEFSIAVAEAAVAMAKDIGAEVIACFTQSGLTARLISKQGAQMPIIAFTPHKRILPRLMILRGVIPKCLPMLKSIDEVIGRTEKTLKAEHLAKAGDNVVIVASAPVSERGATNMLKLHTVR
jgi:pyruvate kinase